MITFSSRHRQRIVYDWMQPRTEDASKDFHRKLKGPSLRKISLAGRSIIDSSLLSCPNERTQEMKRRIFLTSVDDCRAHICWRNNSTRSGPCHATGSTLRRESTAWFGLFLVPQRTVDTVASRPIDIVLFTDGYSFDDPSIIASNLRLSGHRIYIAALFTSYLRYLT